MADITNLKILIDSYGVGVRAGVITPQMIDEEYFRGLMDLPKMSADTLANWSKNNNVKNPITLSNNLAGAGGSSIPASAANPDATGEE